MPARYMNPGELEILCVLVRSVNPKRVVEFGCNVGRTAKVLLRETPNIESYIGVDVNPGYDFTCKVQQHEVPQNPGYLAKDDPRFSLLLSDRGTFDFGPKDLGPADVVFIDGDHSLAAVEHDSNLARDIIRPGGMIIWHDYHTLETVDVRRYLESLVALTGLDIKYVQGTWLAFLQVNAAQ